MVGSGTVISDDPQLDVRLPDYAGPQPRPIVLSGLVTSPLPARSCNGNRCWWPAANWKQHGTWFRWHRDRTGAPCSTQALRAIGEEGYLDILVEGGAGLAAGSVERRAWWTGESSIWPEESPAGGVGPV